VSLARLGDDRELLEEVIAIFLEDAPKLLRQASESLAKGEAVVLERAAHSLKGLSANFAAATTVSAAYAVEFHAREGDLQNAARCLPRLEELVHSLLAALRSSAR
jgi:HPt (histidine-containing phosphotransfer) domain-containing protein